MLLLLCALLYTGARETRMKLGFISIGVRHSIFMMYQCSIVYLNMASSTHHVKISVVKFCYVMY